MWYGVGLIRHHIKVYFGFKVATWEVNLWSMLICSVQSRIIYACSLTYSEWILIINLAIVELT